MRFDLTDLRLFLHVADSGSITAGARLAHLALPSASERIRGMEAMLDTPLLLRERRGVQATDAGRALLHHARLITRQVDAMQADLAEFAGGLKGRVRLLCNTSAMTEFLPDALAGFVATHPQLTIDLEERLSREIVQAVVDELADIGIVSDAADHAALQTFPFRDDPLVLAMAPDHPLARQLKGAAASSSPTRWPTISSDWPATARCSSIWPNKPRDLACTCIAAFDCAASKPWPGWPPAAMQVQAKSR